MSDQAQGSEPPRKLNPQLERFVAAFEGSIDSAERVEKAAEAIILAVNHEQDGLIPAVDQLIDEIRGLREDIRAVSSAGGLRATFKRMRDL